MKKALILCAGILISLSLTSCEEGYHQSNIYEPKTIVHYPVEEHDELTHVTTIVCEKCGDILQVIPIEENIYYSVTSEEVHTKMCQVCGILEEEEEHTNIGAKDGNCEICGFTAGLVYQVRSDGTYSIYSVGTYTGKGLVFPNTYKGCDVVRTSGGGAFGMPNHAVSPYTYLRIPKNMTQIGSLDFVNSTNLETIEFEPGSQLKTIKYDAFYIESENEEEETSLKEVNLPSSVTTIENHAFYRQTSLETISFGEESQLTTIGASAFSHCESLKSVAIPAGVETIENYTFFHCRSLSSVTLEEGLKEIGFEAFCGCTSLTSVTIPSSVEYIGGLAFGNNSALSEVIFTDCAERTTPLTLAAAFYYNTSLRKITLPRSLSVEETCWESGDDIVYAHLFEGCRYLLTIYFYGTEEEWSALTNLGDVSKAKIYYLG
ncbi:MAG: leucine-rich repeat domain-containing protein [Coprobacillus sp.]|nr:leucine-rich repeat domain-containing protein [Coprobacillus sp.]